MDIKTELSEIVKLILADYRPVKNIKDATDLMSTDEILEGVRAVLWVEYDQMIDAMKQAGFIYRNIGEFQFRWLMAGIKIEENPS